MLERRVGRARPGLSECRERGQSVIGVSTTGLLQDEPDVEAVDVDTISIAMVVPAGEGALSPSFQRH